MEKARVDVSVEFENSIKDGIYPTTRKDEHPENKSDARLHI